MTTKPHTTWPHADLTGFLAEHGDDAELEQLADAFLDARSRHRRKPTRRPASRPDLRIETTSHPW